MCTKFSLGTGSPSNTVTYTHCQDNSSETSSHDDNSDDNDSWHSALSEEEQLESVLTQSPLTLSSPQTRHGVVLTPLSTECPCLHGDRVEQQEIDGGKMDSTIAK